MNKAKIILAAICLFAGVGGALAFKARATPGFIRVGTSYVPVTISLDCTASTTGCKYTTGAFTYQLLKFNGVSYYPVAQTIL
jgi:hypothetical protein